MPDTRKQIISQLQEQILLLQGFKAPTGATESIGLGELEGAFPNSIFPLGAIHEFLNAEQEHAAASGGFIAGLLTTLMLNGGACLWVGTSRTLFPPALQAFGVEADRIIFIDVKCERDVLWAMEEALKCEGLAAVIGELREISFAQSRRLQLAVEQSKVTGFILRSDLRKATSTTCVARWKISPIPSELDGGMPGVGFPRWNVELLKVRNGNPGVFQLEWSAGGFRSIKKATAENTIGQQVRKAG
jgi:protein ImuA